MPRKSVQHGTAASPVARACVRSMRIGAAAVARGCVAIVTVAVKVVSDAASESMEVTPLVQRFLATERSQLW